MGKPSPPPPGRISPRISPRISGLSPGGVCVQPRSFYWQRPCWAQYEFALRESAGAEPLGEVLLEVDAFGWRDLRDGFRAVLPGRLSALGVADAAMRAAIARAIDPCLPTWAEADALLRSTGGALPRKREFRRVPLEAMLRRPAAEVSAYATDFEVRFHTAVYHERAPGPLEWWAAPIPGWMPHYHVVPWLRWKIARIPRGRGPSARRAGDWLRRLAAGDSRLRERPPAYPSAPERESVEFVPGPEGQYFRVPCAICQREDLLTLVRSGAVITATICPMSGGEPMPADCREMVSVVARDEAAARRVEADLVSGGRRLYGVGPDIAGVVAASIDGVTSCGVPESFAMRVAQRCSDAELYRVRGPIAGVDAWRWE